MSSPQPLQLISKCIGSKLWIVLRGNKEVYGMLRGYDNYFNIVMDQVTVAENKDGKWAKTEIESMLLNGYDIVFMIPGTYPNYK